jgi:hypothetical protein
VPIPSKLCAYLVAGTLLVMFGSMVWEHVLRELLPAAKPPSKGYMVHGSAAALQAAGGAPLAAHAKKEQ